MRKDSKRMGWLAMVLAFVMAVGLLVPAGTALAAGPNGEDVGSDVADVPDVGVVATAGDTGTGGTGTTGGAGNTGTGSTGTAGGADEEINYYVSHPNHLPTCETQVGGFACGKGATVQFNISPKLAKNGDPLYDLPDTEFTVYVDGSNVMKNSVAYKSGTNVQVKIFGVLPGPHTFSVVGGDTGKYKYKSQSFQGFNNWPIHKDGKQVGGVVSANGTFSLPSTYNWDSTTLEVWAFPAYEEQTSTVAASVTIKDYTAEEKDKMTFELALCDSEGVEVAGQRKTADKSNNWAVKWENLEWGTYQVRNLETNELLAAPTAAFTYEKPSDDITIQAKVTWPGFAAKEIPNSVKLELVDADGKVQDTAAVGAMSNWTAEWKVARGEYTVREKNPPEGTLVEYDSDVFMNRNRVEWSVVNMKAESRSVYLTWSGFQTPPVQTVQVAIRDASGKVAKTLSLTAANGWTASVDDLDPDTYYVCEELTTGSWVASISRMGDGWYIVNQATMSVTATLTWSGFGDGGAPVDTVYVQLIGSNGKSVGSEVALTAARGWRYTWSDLAVDDYTVVEVTTGNWKVDYKISGGTGSGSSSSSGRNMTVAITNTKTNTATVTVKVAWAGFGDKKEPVDYVRMVLKDQYGEQYGGAVQVRASASWSYTWKDLPQGEYTVEQTTTGNWKTEYKQSGTAWTVTNTKTDTLSVTAKVTWAGYSKETDHPDQVVLKLNKAGSTEALMGTATKANNWTYTWTDLQDGGVYTLEEVTTGDWTPEYVKASTTGQSEVWTVKNTKSNGASGGTTSGNGTVSVGMSWTGYEKAPVDSVTLQLLEGSNVIRTGAISGTGLTWSTTFTGLDQAKIDSGAYSIREVIPDNVQWSYAMTGGNGTYTLVNSPTPLAGGTVLGPTGGGTSAADPGGTTLGPSGSGTSAVGSTTYSNPPKTGDHTWVLLLGMALVTGVAGVCWWQRRRLFD